MPAPHRASRRRRALIHLVRRRPATAFLVGAISAGWIAMAVPIVTGLPPAPFVVLTNLGLLGSALLVTRISDGPGAVRRLLARAVQWRFGPGRYALILLGMPAATLAVAATVGTARFPDDWLAFGLSYLFQTVVWGALLMNLWEETAWTGFLQSRLMQRHGLLVGSLLTAPGVVAIHLPLSFLPGWTWPGAAFNLGLVVVTALFMRYLLGMHYLDTRGSLLAAGLQHAAFNASSGLGTAGWEYVPGLVVLTVLVAVARRWTSGAVTGCRGPGGPAPFGR